MANYGLQVNGQSANVTIDDPATPLLFVLQENFQINGAKFGCGLGQCGACTVLLDGQPVRSCQTAISDAAGHSITSLEGLSAFDGGQTNALHPIQQAFVDQQAMQCGFCIAGPMLYGYAYAKSNPNASRADIEDALTGVLCRCCTHTRMIDAIQQFAQGAF